MSRCQYICLIFIFFLSIDDGCFVLPAFAIGAGEPNDTISNQVEAKEGNVFSRERWENIIRNIEQVRPGMLRSEVVGILGKPDGVSFSPQNVLQYSVAFGVLGNFQPGAIHIVLDESGTVIEVLKGQNFFGPPPQ